MFSAKATLGVGATVVGVALTAQAVPIGVVPTKLIVVDKLTAASKAKAVFVAKDANVTKGPGTDVDRISVTFDVEYDGTSGAAHGRFSIPSGSGAPGWKANRNSVAKYVNTGAPGGPTAAKVAIVKPTKLLKLVANERGEAGEQLDIVGVGAPMPGTVVSTAYCVTNGGQTNCHCSQFSAAGQCVHKPIAGGSGAKLVCKGGFPDASCAAGCVTAPAAPWQVFGTQLTAGTFVDCGDRTVYDTRLRTIGYIDPTGPIDLQWEQKDGDDGIEDLDNLHDVDNFYVWAGCCEGACSNVGLLCQPNEAASVTCFEQADLTTAGCQTCNGVPCRTFGTTTVWDWINQVNTEGGTGFAGHADWRLASQAGSDSTCDGCSRELETILDPTRGFCGNAGSSAPCIDPIFGPTSTFLYWSASTVVANPFEAWLVTFGNGAVDAGLKNGDVFGVGGAHVRAVR